MKEVSKSTFHHLVCYYFKIVFYYILLQFPRWLSGKESTWGMDGFVGMQGMWVLSLGWEDPVEKEMQLTQVFLPWKSHGQRNLAGYSPWGHKESERTD